MPSSIGNYEIIRVGVQYSIVDVSNGFINANVDVFINLKSYLGHFWWFHLILTEILTEILTKLPISIRNYEIIQLGVQ